MKSHPSSLAMDRLSIGALTPDEAARVRKHLEACATCRERVAEDEAARARFTRSVLPRRLPALARPRRWTRFVFALAPAVVVVTLILIISRRQPGSELAGKGGATMQVFARRGERVFLVADRSTLRSGDELRFVVQPAGRRFLLVSSIDGAGHSSVYYPFDGRASGALDPRARTELPDTVRLDTAPGPERLFALFTDAPLDAADVRKELDAIGAHGGEAIRATTTLARVERAEQLSLVFEKEPR